MVGGCPTEFARLPIDIVLEGCLDKLGKFNKQHITLTFILKQGLWFTQQESKDLTEKTPSGEFREKSEVAKERLGLKPSVNLYMTPKGLSFTQLRAMVNLKSKKYSEKEKKLVAYHEAGHAVVGIKLEDANEVQKITIVPRGAAGGYNLMLPKEEKFFSTKTELEQTIC